MKFLTKYFLRLIISSSSLALIFNSCNNVDKKKDNQIVEEVKPPLPPGNDRNVSYLILDTLKGFVKFTPSLTISGKLKRPFDKLVFNKVIAYDYDGSEEPYPSIFDRDKQFIPIVEKQRALSELQTRQVIDLLTSTNTYGGTTAACFQPHLSIVFYNNENPVFVTDICLGCNYLNASVEIPAMHFKKIGKGTGNEYSAIGFSKKGKSGIRLLCKQLDFFYGE